MAPPLPTGKARFRLHRSPGRFLAAIAALSLLLLVSCAEETPSVQAVTTTSAPAESTTTTTEAPQPRAPVDLSPPSADNLLGYIATPQGDPMVFSEPSESSEPIEVAPVTAIGAPTTFAVLGDPTDGVGVEWIQVALPERPNSSTGWVQAHSVEVTHTDLRLSVDMEARTLTIERGAETVLDVDVAIGTEANPTPPGATYLTELIESIEPEGAYGPYALGLALHSDTLTEFAGGPGQVGIHGTNRPDLIGQRVSSGCVRMTNDDIRALVDLQVPLGMPVFIT